MSEKRQKTADRSQVEVSTGDWNLVEDVAPPLSDRASAVFQHALAAFGNREKALHWLSRPNPLLDGDCPIQILWADSTRLELVDDELTRIEHGVFA